MKRLHGAFCERKHEPNHVCHGRIIIDRNGRTLSCPFCGDQRSIYPTEER